MTVAPGLAAWAMPWGPVRADAYATLRHRLLDGLRAAQRGGPVDGVLLVLHGAMQARGTDDAEGDLLGAVRREIGPATPLPVASLDLHANVTQAMAADALVAYHTMPHTDMYETGRAVDGPAGAGGRPGRCGRCLAVRKLPLVTPAERHDHRHPPMAPLMARTLAPPALPLSVSLCPVQPWLDVPELGWTVLAVADGDRAAQRAADGLAAAAWERREAFRVPKLTPADVARRAARRRPGRPLVVSDSGDNTSGGAPGDSVHLLRGLLAARRAGGPAGSALLWLADAARPAPAWRPGRRRGGADPVPGQQGGRALRPAAAGRGRVERVVDPAHYVVRGPSWTGSRMDLGTAAVLTLTAAGDDALDPVGGPPLRLLVCARPVMDIDPGLYRCAGEHPEAYQLVQVRSPAGFRAAVPAARRRGGVGGVARPDHERSGQPALDAGPPPAGRNRRRRARIRPRRGRRGLPERRGAGGAAGRALTAGAGSGLLGAKAETETSAGAPRAQRATPAETVAPGAGADPPERGEERSSPGARSRGPGGQVSSDGRPP